MISQNHSSQAALLHSKRQRLEVRLKALAFSMWRMKAEYEQLVKMRDALDQPQPQTWPVPPPKPEPEPLPEPEPPPPPPPLPEHIRKRGKFPNEVLEHVREMVARGIGSAEIAERIGVPVTSLKVTCCRRGISLRRPNGSYQRKKRNGQ